MRYDPEIRHRRSIRLKGYDYACAGAVFVTICTQGRTCLFGEIANNKMVLNDAGMMVQRVWEEMQIRFKGLQLDEYVIMPNHIHAIIMLPDPRRGEPCVRPLHIRPVIHPNDEDGQYFGDQNTGDKNMGIGSIAGWF